MPATFQIKAINDFGTPLFKTIEISLAPCTSQTLSPTSGDVRIDITAGSSTIVTESELATTYFTNSDNTICPITATTLVDYTTLALVSGTADANKIQITAGGQIQVTPSNFVSGFPVA